MLRFLFPRFLFIVVVSYFIVFAVQFGMQWIRHSREFDPGSTSSELLVGSLQDSAQYLSNAIRGDFGTYVNVTDEREVVELLDQSLPASLGLLAVSLVVSLLIGVPLGIWVAVRRKSGLTFSVLVATMVGVSIPSFFLALLLQQGVITYFQIYGSRPLNVAGFGWDYKHMLLPAIVLSVRPIAYLMRTSHIAFERTLQEDYVRTANAKGMPGRRVINVHALRNVGVPLITAAGLSLRFSLAVLPIVEYLFGWPGLGLRLLQGITNNEANIAMTFALIFGLLLMFTNVVLELSYRLIDPRLREVA